MMRLYRANFSTNAERVALALGHKGIEVESRYISYDDRSEVERVSGQPLVPVLVDGDNVDQRLDADHRLHRLARSQPPAAVSAPTTRATPR